MSISRRDFLKRLGIWTPALAVCASGVLRAENRPWRRSWNGQLPLKNLPLDEALEIIYDNSLNVPVRKTAAGRLHGEVRSLLIEFKDILKKANGNLGPYMPRIQYMSIVVPAGLNALVHFGTLDTQSQAMSTVWLKDLIKQL